MLHNPIVFNPGSFYSKNTTIVLITFLSEMRFKWTLLIISSACVDTIFKVREHYGRCDTWKRFKVSAGSRISHWGGQPAMQAFFSKNISENKRIVSRGRGGGWWGAHPILSFSHTFSLKSAHVGGGAPTNGKFWIRPDFYQFLIQ